MKHKEFLKRIRTYRILGWFMNQKPVLSVISLPMLMVMAISFGCGLIGDDIKDHDLVGVWVEDRKNCENELSDCAMFEFREDGSFTAWNLPDEYFSYFLPRESLFFDTSGKWEIEWSADPLRDDMINLRFDPIPEMNYPVYWVSMYVEGTKGDFTLFMWHGDPTNRMNFYKLTGGDNL